MQNTSKAAFSKALGHKKVLKLVAQYLGDVPK